MRKEQPEVVRNYGGIEYSLSRSTAKAGNLKAMSIDLPYSRAPITCTANIMDMYTAADPLGRWYPILVAKRAKIEVPMPINGLLDSLFFGG